MIKVDAALNQRFSVTCVAAKIVRKNAEGKLVKRGGFSFALIIGIKKSRKQLYKLIDQRLEQRLNQGMVNEVKKLLKQKISHKRLQEMGLEYRFISLYLQDHLTYEQMVEQLKSAIHKFSKRQMTWFQTDKRIKWISSEKQAERLIKDYIKPSRPRTTIRGRDPS